MNQTILALELNSDCMWIELGMHIDQNVHITLLFINQSEHNLGLNGFFDRKESGSKCPWTRVG